MITGELHTLALNLLENKEYQEFKNKILYHMYYKGMILLSELKTLDQEEKAMQQGYIAAIREIIGKEKEIIRQYQMELEKKTSDEKELEKLKEIENKEEKYGEEF